MLKAMSNDSRTRQCLFFLTQPSRRSGQKKQAEHGAASRAYDCFSYRQHFGTSISPVRLGLEVPYLSKEQAQSLTQPPPPRLPPLPPAVQLRVRDLLRKVKVTQQVEEVNRAVFAGVVPSVV